VTKQYNPAREGSALATKFLADSLISEQDYTNQKAWGILTSIDLFDCDPDILRNAKLIEKYIIELCELIEMKRFGEPVIVNFGADPVVAGFSMVQLIETSCISGHFANDSNSIYIDIFSCKWYNQEQTLKFTEEFFKSKSSEMRVVLRGRGINQNKNL